MKSYKRAAITFGLLAITMLGLARFDLQAQNRNQAAHPYASMKSMPEPKLFGDVYQIDISALHAQP